MGVKISGTPQQVPVFQQVCLKNAGVNYQVALKFYRNTFLNVLDIR